MDLKLDDKQLERALDAIKSPPGLSLRLQKFKLILEMVALVAAGIWAVIIYWTVQRAAARLVSEQVKHKLEARISIDPRIDIRKLKTLSPDSAAYEVSYRYDITSTSEKNTPIAFVAMEWFIGSPGDNPSQSFRANLPTTEGAILWKSRSIEVHIKPGIEKRKPGTISLLIGPKTDPSREAIVKEDYEGGVGEYEPGESAKEERVFYIIGKPDMWVGFNLRIGVEREDGEIEEYYSKDHETLAAETASQEKRIEAGSRPGDGP